MSLLIEDLNMPTTCGMCWFSTFCDVWNAEPLKYKGYNNRLDDCPLAELIRCKDCKYADEYFHCGKVKWWTTKDDYCSRGEKKEE